MTLRVVSVIGLILMFDRRCDRAFMSSVCIVSASSLRPYVLLMIISANFDEPAFQSLLCVETPWYSFVKNICVKSSGAVGNKNLSREGSAFRNSITRAQE